MTPAMETMPDAALQVVQASLTRIQADIDNITYLPAALARSTSSEITQAIARLEMMTVTKEQFGPMVEQAVMARDTTISALMELRESARNKERPGEVLHGEIEHVNAEKSRQQVQQQNAMRTIHAMQEMGQANGSAGALRLIIDSVAATPIQAEEYGVGVDAVKLAQQTALDTLRPKYEQAMISEMGDKLRAAADQSQVAPLKFDMTLTMPYSADHDAADDLIDEADASDDEILLAVAHHFGWSREKAKSRLICIDFNNMNKDNP